MIISYYMHILSRNSQVHQNSEVSTIKSSNYFCSRENTSNIFRNLGKPWQALASLGISNHLSTEAAFSKWQAAAFIAGPKPSLVTGLGVPFCQVDQVPHVMCCSMGIQNSRCDGQVRILGKQRCRSWDLLLIKLFTTPSPEIYHKGL